MEQYQLVDPDRNLIRRQPAANPTARQSYLEGPAPVLVDEAGSGLLLEYWRILQRRKGTFLLSVCVGLLLAVLLTLPQAPLYRAHTTLEIQNLNENFLNMRDVSPTANEGGTNPIETDLQTQVNILQSDSVLRQVITELDLGRRLAAERQNGRLAAWRKALRLPELATSSKNEDVLREVASNLKIHMQANTRLVEVSYDSADPAVAADVVNTLTAEYIHQDLKSRWQTSQETGKWLAGQMEDVRIKLENSEAELQKYAREAGLLFTSDNNNVADEKLRQLQGELSKAQADRIVCQSKYELARTATADSLPEVLDDPTLKDYQVKLTDLRRQFAELSSTLTPAHPSVKKVQAQVTTLEAALEKERTNVTRRIQNEFESAQQRENLLLASYNAQARVVTEQAAKVTHYNILKREVDNDRQLYDSMLQHVKEAGIASALRASNVRVIDPATPPTRPYKPSLVLNAAGGLFAGAFLGFVFIVTRERADQSIQTPGESSLWLNVPELGAIPSAKAERRPYFRGYRPPTGLQIRQAEGAEEPSRVELVTWQQRPSVVADSFRSTLASILYMGENGDRPRVIAVTSASPGEGKTTVASNLALALAEIGRRVLLIDGDLRKPRLHEIFAVSNVNGLTDLLNSAKLPEGPDAMAAGTKYPGLYVLPAGSVPASIASLLYSPRTMELLQKLRQEYDFIIIDTPPMLQMPDARVLGRLADGLILVVRSGRTTREAAAAAAVRLSTDGTRVLGAVLNEWDPRRKSRSGYGYGYTYGYGYGGSRSYGAPTGPGAVRE